MFDKIKRFFKKLLKAILVVAAIILAVVVVYVLAMATIYIGGYIAGAYAGVGVPAWLTSVVMGAGKVAMFTGSILDGVWALGKLIAGGGIFKGIKESLSSAGDSLSRGGLTTAAAGAGLLYFMTTPAGRRLARNAAFLVLGGLYLYGRAKNTQPSGAR